MKIDKKQIDHLSKLSKLKLDSSQEKEFTQNLNDILGYVESLGEVDTEGIVSTAQITGLKNVWREDLVEVSDEITKNEIKRNIPEMEDDYTKVKRVL